MTVKIKYEDDGKGKYQSVSARVEVDGDDYFFPGIAGFGETEKEATEDLKSNIIPLLVQVENVLQLGNQKWIYPYEESPEQRMTNRQFVEWLDRGNGQWKWKDNSLCHTNYPCPEEKGNAEVDENILIRPWASSDWIEPTVDIYERDCKGGKK